MPKHLAKLLVRQVCGTAAIAITAGNDGGIPA